MRWLIDSRLRRSEIFDQNSDFVHKQPKGGTCRKHQIELKTITLIGLIFTVINIADRDGKQIEQRRFPVRGHARLHDSGHPVNLNSCQFALIDRRTRLSCHPADRWQVPAKSIGHHHKSCMRPVKGHVFARNNRVLKQGRQNFKIVRSAR